VLVTFDDAYTDLLSAACPLLVERGIPAVAFAVAGRTGGTNTWASSGAGVLDLLDADGLRAVAERGVEIGSRGASHRPLPSITPRKLRLKIATARWPERSRRRVLRRLRVRVLS